MDPISEELNNFRQGFTFTGTGEVLAEVDKFGDELRFSSGLELSPASEELKIENIDTSNADENFLLPKSNLGNLDLNIEDSEDRTLKTETDPLIGQDNDPVQEVDSLISGTSDRVNNIQTRAAKKRDKAGNSRGKAHNLGVLEDDQKLQEFVGKSDRKDFYKFKVKNKTDIDIELGGLSGNADLYLLNNRGKVIEKSNKGGKRAEDIERTLNPGTYYVRVQSKGRANANYNLSLDSELSDLAGNSLKRAHNLGVLKDDQKFQEFVGKSDRKDIYKFKVKDKTDVDIELGGLSGNADLYLLNNRGKVIEKSTKGGKRVEDVDRTLNPGTYYVRVQSRNKRVNADYSLSLDTKSPHLHIHEPIIINAIDTAADQPGTLDDSSTIDLMVVYTSEARRAEGGIDAIKDLIEFAVDDANEAFAKSGVQSQLRLVHTAEVNYTESGKSIKELERLKNDSDGYMDEVHELRNDYGADIVSLFVSSLDDAGGIAYPMGTPAYQFESHAFNVVTNYNAKTRHTLAHEIGHNLGLAHDRDNAEGQGSFPYGYGYTTPSGAGTIMSYARNRLPYFSNPAISYNGEALGQTNRENSALAINKVAQYAANWRPSGGTIKSQDSITLNSPNGGNTLEQGSNYTITWNDNISENIKLELYKGGSFYSTINSSTTSDGSYSWSIPTSITSGSDYKLKISSVSDSSLYDYSDSNFTIEPEEFITLTAPNGGNSLEPGRSYYIDWEDNISENVKLELYKGGSFYSTINSSTSSDGRYNIWTVPTSITSGSDYKIKISSVSDSGLYDYSDSNFTIEPEEFITVTAPNGGNSLEPGISYYLDWEDNIGENVKLELYKGGSFYSTINSSTSSDGRYTWLVPTSITSGSDYKIKITSVSDSGLYDYSDSNFTIEADDSNSDKYYFTYFYDLGDSYDGFLYEKAGRYSLDDSLYSSNGRYQIWDIESGVGSKNDIGDVYVYSYYDENYTGETYEPSWWTWGLTAGENGLGSESDTISGFYGEEYFDPYNEADG